MSNESDYPGKIKNLRADLRVCKEKIRENDEKLRREERSSIQQQEYMVRLEETARELKAKNQSKEETK